MGENTTEVRKYRPSNGTEGECFIEEWCGSCARDKTYQKTGSGGCSIVADTFVYSIDDPKYPTAWRYVDGEPRCTRFEDGDPPTEQDAKYLVWKAAQDGKKIETSGLGGRRHMEFPG